MKLMAFVCLVCDYVYEEGGCLQNWQHFFCNLKNVKNLKPEINLKIDDEH
jgi:hypothetical protein